jgi:Uma2 family endonuclease
MIQRATQAPHLGPTDHGRRLSYDQFMAASYQEGYKYEIIDGELYVSPLPNLPYDLLEKWLLVKFVLYSTARGDVINHVTDKARVFVPDREDLTAPEPDLAAYKDFPKDLPDEELDWRNVSPVLVAEVISPDDPDKDLVRNVALYLQITSIKEYWVFDTRESVALPILRVYRRQGKKWKVMEVAPGATYTTRLLPGFELVVDRRK